MKADTGRRDLILKRVLIGLTLLCALHVLPFVSLNPAPTMAGWTPGCPELSADPWQRIEAARFEHPPLVGSGDRAHTPLWLATEHCTAIADWWEEGHHSELHLSAPATRTVLDGGLYPRWEWEPLSMRAWEFDGLIWLPCISVKGPMPNRLVLLALDPATLQPVRSIPLPLPARAVRGVRFDSDVAPVAHLPDGALVIGGILSGDWESTAPGEGICCWRIEIITNQVVGPVITPVTSQGQSKMAGAPATGIHDTSLVTLDGWLPSTGYVKDVGGAWEITAWPADAAEPTWVLRPSNESFTLKAAAAPPVLPVTGPWVSRPRDFWVHSPSPVRIALDLNLVSTQESATSQAFKLAPKMTIPPATYFSIVGPLIQLDDTLRATSRTEGWRWRQGYVVAPWLPSQSVVLPDETAIPMQRCLRKLKHSRSAPDSDPFGLALFVLDPDTTLVTQLVLEPPPGADDSRFPMVRLGRLEPPLTAIAWDGFVTLPAEAVDYPYDLTMQLYADTTGLRLLLTGFQRPGLYSAPRNSNPTDPGGAGYWYTHCIPPSAWPPLQPGWYGTSLRHPETARTPELTAPLAAVTH
ncbi:MAG: hypothetical protein ABI743_00505 [bacterium]